MPLAIRENVLLAPLTTFGIGGAARYLAEIKSETNIPEALAFAAERGLPTFILGGGSNLLVPDTGYPGLVLHMQISGITQHKSTFLVGAGVVWDDFVNHTLAANFAGVECMAGIPGFVGGTPVQNVGAYGQEVSETITQVRAFDRTNSTFVDLPHDACRFRYRASLFNTDAPNRYIVTQVSFTLRPNGAPTLKYADLQRHFAHHPKPTLIEVAAAVREIRRSKGMLLVDGDPDTRSAGSFFKNPIVPAETLARAAQSSGLPIEKVPHWPAGEGKIKLPAAWLLEHAGFVKGYGEGPVGISSRHTLALVNRGHASFADVERLQQQIISTVKEKFGIELEREPVLLA